MVKGRMSRAARPIKVTTYCLSSATSLLNWSLASNAEEDKMPNLVFKFRIRKINFNN